VKRPTAARFPRACPSWCTDHEGKHSTATNELTGKEPAEECIPVGSHRSMLYLIEGESSRTFRSVRIEQPISDGGMWPPHIYLGDDAGHSFTIGSAEARVIGVALIGASEAIEAAFENRCPSCGDAILSNRTICIPCHVDANVRRRTGLTIVE